MQTIQFGEKGVMNLHRPKVRLCWQVLGKLIIINTCLSEAYCVKHGQYGKSLFGS